MRLTTVDQMALPAGTLHAFAVRATPEPLLEQPVSFDQNLHVGRGDRPGSWMAVSFRLGERGGRPSIPALPEALPPNSGDTAEADRYSAQHADIARVGRSSGRQRAGGDEIAEAPVANAEPDTDVLVRASALRDALAAAWRRSVARHGTLRTVFTLDDGRVRLHEAAVDAGAWRDHPVAAGESTRDALRRLLDAECRPFATPSCLLTVVVPEGADAELDPRPVVVIASDHAHVDMWSLLILADEVRAVAEAPADAADADSGARADADAEDASDAGARATAAAATGAATGTAAPDDLPAPFVDHTRALLEAPAAPADVTARWEEILRAGGGLLPVFPLPLGDVSTPSAAAVEVRDLLDADRFAALEARARAAGVRVIASVMTSLAAALQERAGNDEPVRALFPVHSRIEPRWRDSVGWYITNAVLEIAAPTPEACAAGIADAVRLGAHPLAPIFDRLGGVPATPGLFAISWLDMRRMPLRLDESLEPQFVSAVLPTDGLMIWFVVNESGLHLRCRYPDNPVARASVGGWLDALGARIVDAAGGAPALSHDS